jgi:hypothetical protein
MKMPKLHPGLARRTVLLGDLQEAPGAQEVVGGVE